MTLRLALAIAAMAAALPAPAAAELAVHPVYRNISAVCKGQQRCIDRQIKSMKRAFAYMRAHRPAVWKIELCNRNASRKRTRVDWTGFDNCIRNSRLRPAAAAGRR